MRPAGFEPAIIPVSEGRVERIINSLRFQATPRALRFFTWRTSAPSQPSCRPPAFPRSPTALPRPDSNRGSLVQGQEGLPLPHGAVSQRRRRAGNAARDGVAQRPNTKTNGIPDPLQRILAALPSSSVANRCWDSTRPDGFRNAVCIIAVKSKEEGLFADFGVDRAMQSR